MAKTRLDYPLTANQLRELLDYDPVTGRFTWRHREPLTQYDRTWNTRYAGMVAGTLTVPHCAVQIMVNGQIYLAHRLAFLWMTGEWSKAVEIDHVDTNPWNNAWNNLREATHSQNKMNIGLRRDNTTGHKGVWFEKRRNHWIAEVWSNGSKHQIGSFPTAEEAKAARDAAARRLHGKFARTS
jgi:hypothetical protein